MKCKLPAIALFKPFILNQIAKHFREVYFGGNWTYSNLKENLTGVTVEQANKQIDSINTIATLVYHMHYYVRTVTKVLRGEQLNSSDKQSFEHPPFTTQKDWDDFLEKVWTEAEEFALLVEKLPDSILAENIADPKYGIYYRNLHGIIEHTHYHLGQIAVLKKLITI